MRWFRLLILLKLRALVNPAVAADLLRVWWRYRRRRWRMYTAYGSEDAIPPVADVLRYARWTRHHP